MDIAVVGAGMAGLSAAWSLDRAGHHVMLFERNYKAGGRLNSRRKAGLVVDHGQWCIFRGQPVLRELVVDSGLYRDLRPIARPIYQLAEDGTFADLPKEESEEQRLVFPGGMLVLPDALRRRLGGFYSIRVTSVEWDSAAGKYRIRTDPPMREEVTQVDAMVLACAAPEALRVAEPIRAMLREEFIKRAERVQYTRCIVMIAALEKVRLERPFYGLRVPQRNGGLLSWLAFENEKCEGRGVEEWSSLVAHLSPEASERCWDDDEEQLLARVYAEARRVAPELPRECRWARSKRWEIAKLAPENEIVDHETCPAADPDVMVEFCGDYRAGDGAENAATSGRRAAETLLEKIKTRPASKI